MKIEIYKDNEVYECEITHQDIGTWYLKNKSENIRDIDCDIIQEDEFGFTDKLEIYL